ncbi:GAF domain-containing sensor histidine kinase [Arenibaculum pallidiluteum]|uniref:GAF domain-containing sensor histidine kinase n=1 Tax=Arenibaculum pallidiluteum TaxID=2812559 RepID=UPI001A9772DB|nr:GAF domain-containing sensor histidine kinase [Arenibaculum pallidiluteum]
MVSADLDDATVITRLLEISRAIAGLTDGDEILAALAAAIRHLIPHDHLDIALVEERAWIHRVYEAGLKTGWSRPGAAPQDIARSPIRAVLWGQEPFLLTDDALEDPRFHFQGAHDEPIFTHRLRSRIHVPLRVQGDIIGAVSISAHDSHAYHGRDLVLAQHCADLIAPYFWAMSRAEQARRAAVAEAQARTRKEILRQGVLRLTEGMERERQRIAMDIHDQTLADLARIARAVAKLRERGPASDADLLAVERDVATCLHELRRIVEDLKPGVLNVFGFVEAVEALLAWQAGDPDAGDEAACRWEVRDHSGGAVDRLPDTVRTALYRIVQEAINNAVRHSGGSFVAVRVAQAEDGIAVSVSDDGIGLPDGKLRGATGGLSHMTTRAELIGAGLSIGAGPSGRGAAVTITLPSRREGPAPCAS